MRTPLDIVIRQAAGGVVTSGELYVYERGTKTPAVGYTTETGKTEVTYPLTPDSEGRFPEAWYEPGSYDIYRPGDAINPTQPWEAPGLPSSVARSSNEPAEAPGFMTAYNVKDAKFGAKGDGETDDAAAITKAFEAAATASATVFIPKGTYAIKSALTLPVGASLVLDPEATVKATATIAGPMLTVGDLVTKWRDKVLSGGTWDCNGNAEGISVPYYLNVTLREITVLNPTKYGVVMGSTEAPGESNEHRVNSVKVDRDSSGALATVPEGSIGIYFRNGGDGVAIDCTVVGANTSFRNDKTNRFIGCHGWGWAEHFPETVFDDNANGSTYIACEPDTPSKYGYDFAASNWQIIGGRVFNNTSGSDNVVIGIHTAVASPTASILGVQFIGSASHRLAKDYDGTVPSSGLVALGCFNSNVALGFLTTNRGNFLSLSNLLEIAGEIKHTGTKVGLYGATPVTRHAAIASPAAELAALKTAVDALREAVKNVGITE